VAFVRTNVSEEHIVFIMKTTRIGELETTLAITTTEAHSEEAIRSSEASVLAKAIRCNVP
jgi:hypothetical protein